MHLAGMGVACPISCLPEVKDCVDVIFEPVKSSALSPHAVYVIYGHPSLFVHGRGPVDAVLWNGVCDYAMLHWNSPIDFYDDVISVSGDFWNAFDCRGLKICACLSWSCEPWGALDPRVSVKM